MSIEAVIALIQMVEKQLEDLWIEREVLCLHLRQHDYSIEQLTTLLDAAKSDPRHRERARQTYTQMREKLETAAKEAAVEAVLEQPPPAGQPN